MLIDANAFCDHYRKRAEHYRRALWDISYGQWTAQGAVEVANKALSAERDRG
jgi:hypothetical protein